MNLEQRLKRLKTQKSKIIRKENNSKEVEVENEEIVLRNLRNNEAEVLRQQSSTNDNSCSFFDSLF